MVLGISSLLVLYIFGCLWHFLGVLLSPICLIALHTASRKQLLSTDDSIELAMELRHRLVRVLHGEHLDSEEMESGSSRAEVSHVDGRDAELVRRVEQVRQKYR